MAWVFEKQKKKIIKAMACCSHGDSNHPQRVLSNYSNSIFHETPTITRRCIFLTDNANSSHTRRRRRRRRRFVIIRQNFPDVKSNILIFSTKKQSVLFTCSIYLETKFVEYFTIDSLHPTFKIRKFAVRRYLRAGWIHFERGRYFVFLNFNKINPLNCW